MSVSWDFSSTNIWSYESQAKMPSTVLRKRFHGHPVWRWRIGVLLIMGTLALLTMTKFQGDVTPTHESEFIALPEKVPLAKPKLAFLYLARNQMPLDILWAHFFKVQIHLKSEWFSFGCSIEIITSTENMNVYKIIWLINSDLQRNLKNIGWVRIRVPKSMNTMSTSMQGLVWYTIGKQRIAKLSTTDKSKIAFRYELCRLFLCQFCFGLERFFSCVWSWELNVQVNLRRGGLSSYYCTKQLFCKNIDFACSFSCIFISSENCFAGRVGGSKYGRSRASVTRYSPRGSFEWTFHFIIWQVLSNNSILSHCVFPCLSHMC